MDRVTDLSFDLGWRIRDARYRAGRTQEEVADVAGTSTSTLSRMELGHGANVPLGTWDSVAAAVGVDLFAPIEARHDVYVDAIGRLIESGGWTPAGQELDSASFDRPPRRVAAGRRSVQAPAERIIVRVVWIVTDIQVEMDRLRMSVESGRAHGLPGRAIEGVIIVVRSTATARRLSGTTWDRSSSAWIRALRSEATRMPAWPGLVWVARRATHLLAGA